MLSTRALNRFTRRKNAHARATRPNVPTKNSWRPFRLAFAVGLVFLIFFFYRRDYYRAAYELCVYYYCTYGLFYTHACSGTTWKGIYFSCFSKTLSPQLRSSPITRSGIEIASFLSEKKNNPPNIMLCYTNAFVCPSSVCVYLNCVGIYPISIVLLPAYSRLNVVRFTRLYVMILKKKEREIRDHFRYSVDKFDVVATALWVDYWFESCGSRTHCLTSESDAINHPKRRFWASSAV